MPKIACPGCGLVRLVLDDDDGMILCLDCGKPLDWTGGKGRLASGRRQSESPLDGDLQKRTRSSYRARTRNRPNRNQERLWWIFGGFAVFGTLAVAISAFIFIWATSPTEKERKPEVHFSETARVYLDNGGAESLTLFLDDKIVLEVPAKDMKDLSCSAGDHRITVKQGENIVFDETKKLESFMFPKKAYVLNPGKTNRYGYHVIQYGKPVGSLPADEDRRTRKIMAQIDLLPPVAWHETRADFIFQPAPSTVNEINVIQSTSRTVLNRIPIAEYDYLSAAAVKKEKFSNEERRRLEALVEYLMKSSVR